MTGYVVESLSAKYSQSTEKLVYFFCQYDDETSLQATTILQSIIRQLLDQDDARFTVNERSIEATLDNPHDVRLLEALLLDTISSLKSVVIILDGIDECPLSQMKTLLKILRSLILRQYAGLSCISQEMIVSLILSNRPWIQVMWLVLVYQKLDPI